MTVKTATDRSTSAPMPSATAMTWTYTPITPPTTAASPAARPSCSARLITKSTFGPGTTISADESSANASRWPVGSIVRSVTALAGAWPAVSGRPPAAQGSGCAVLGCAVLGRWAIGGMKNAQHAQYRRAGVLQAVQLPGRQVRTAARADRLVADAGVQHALAGEYEYQLIVGMAVLRRPASRDLADELGGYLAPPTRTEQHPEGAVPGRLDLAVGQVASERWADSGPGADGRCGLGLGQRHGIDVQLSPAVRAQLVPGARRYPPRPVGGDR